MVDLCFDCAVRISGKSWPLIAEDGSFAILEIPVLVDGLCPVCAG